VSEPKGALNESRLVRIWLPAGLLLLAAVVSIRLIGPRIPDEIYLLTGPEGSAYHQDGERYQAYLEGRGVKTHIVETGGALENLQRLLADTTARARVGFVEAGAEYSLADTAGVRDELAALGSLYLEPLWLFASPERQLSSDAQLGGLRIAAGPDGSMAGPLARLLLRDNGILENVVLVFFWAAGGATLDALRAREIDGIFVVGEPGSPILDSLIASPDLRPVAFRRAEAFARRHPYLTHIRLPEGTLDIARNIPASELPLIAGAVNLAARKDLPAALVDVVLDAAREVHKEPTVFSDRREFPNPTVVSLPLSHAAEMYFEQGPSRLSGVLPFWLSTLVNRSVWAIATFAGSVLAIFGLLPRLLGLRFTITLRRLYRRLERIEKGLDDGDREAALAELDDIDARSAELRVPRDQRPPYFELRQNIHDLRDRVRGSRTT
jgi:TRAP-type uncharacterized transport system substrate-binding protein